MIIALEFDHSAGRTNRFVLLFRMCESVSTVGISLLTACRGVSRGMDESEDSREYLEVRMPIGSKFVVTNCSVAYLIVHKSISAIMSVITGTYVKEPALPVRILLAIRPVAIPLGDVPFCGVRGCTS